MSKFIESDEFVEMVKHNQWHPPSEFMKNMERIFACAANQNWHWAKNWDCKYIDIRVDMRDGGHIIAAKDNRVSVDAIEHQDDWGMTRPSERENGEK